MGIMILNAIQIYTTIFLTYASVAFVYSALKNETAIVGNVICSLSMLLALFLIWL